jgi:photosystem II stability/assembly factor-like uncharacterized protein
MSQTTLWIGTGRGLFKAEGNGGGYAVKPMGLQESGGLRCPVVIDKDDPRRLYAGTFKRGVFVSEDGGATWREANSGLDRLEVWWLEQHPKTGELWAGTSPSAMYKSADRGQTWTECKALQSLPTIPEWSFPQPPHISHVKHLSLQLDDPNHVLGAVEEGWIIRTTDGGATWENLRNGCEFDAHTVYFMPDNPRVVVTTSGQGFYRSEDGGDSFEKTITGMDRRYMAQLVVHPDRPKTMFTAAAEVPPPGWMRPEGGNSAFYRSDDQGLSWRRLTGGLPDHIKPAPRFAAGDPEDPDSVFMGLTDGSVWATRNGGESFERILEVSPPAGANDATAVHTSNDPRFSAITSIRVSH